MPGVVVLQGVEGMGIGGEDPVETVLSQGLVVFFEEKLKEPLFTQAADLMAVSFSLGPSMAKSIPARCSSAATVRTTS